MNAASNPTDVPRTPRAAVVIPLYKPQLSKSERYSVEMTVERLGHHDIFLVGPQDLAGELRALAANSGSATIATRTYQNRYFASIAGYNNLMRSRSFYESFNAYEYILIAQTDALVLSDELSEWCGKEYSYVGAPWFHGLNKPQLPLTLMAAGNGGFSLRRVTDFVRVLSKPRYIPNLILSEAHRNPPVVKLMQLIKHKLIRSYNFPPLFPDINEDFFWGLLVPRSCSFFKTPTAEEACSFAFEREPRFLFELNGRRLPFGCHGWEKYDPDFWRSAIGTH